MAYGYIWHYEDTPESEYYTPKTTNKKICCLETGETFSSISEASRVMHINRKGINNCILNKQKCKVKLNSSK